MVESIAMTFVLREQEVIVYKKKRKKRKKKRKKEGIKRGFDMGSFAFLLIIIEILILFNLTLATSDQSSTSSNSSSGSGSSSKDAVAIQVGINNRQERRRVNSLESTTSSYRDQTNPQAAQSGKLEANRSNNNGTTSGKNVPITTTTTTITRNRGGVHNDDDDDDDDDDDLACKQEKIQVIREHHGGVRVKRSSYYQESLEEKYGNEKVEEERRGNDEVVGNDEQVVSLDHHSSSSGQLDNEQQRHYDKLPFDDEDEKDEKDGLTNSDQSASVVSGSEVVSPSLSIDVEGVYHDQNGRQPSATKTNSLIEDPLASLERITPNIVDRGGLQQTVPNSNEGYNLFKHHHHDLDEKNIMTSQRQNNHRRHSHRRHYHHNNHHHQHNHETQGYISPISSPSIASLGHSSRTPWWRHKEGTRFNDWCQIDCKSFYGSNKGQSNKRSQICASDGHFYATLCDLRHHSCRNDIYLFKKSKNYCKQQQQQQQSRQIQTQPMSDSNNNNASEELRFIELKGRCNRLQLEDMKLLLLKEFNGDLSSMFKYFDSNGDNYIEAHELWPRKNVESNKLLFARLWDDHSTKCHSHLRHWYGNSNLREIDTGYENINEDNIQDDHLKKCWYFLDFAFEPEFATNPCSLSHLMLFELQHPNHRFDYTTFRQAFLSTRLEALNNSKTNSSNIEPAIRRVSHIIVNLGDSISLNCLQNYSRNLARSEELLEDNLIEEDAIEYNESGARCLWTRYNLNLATIQDQHISIEERTFLKSNGNLPDLMLHLKDSQLYLSGQFKCNCHLKKLARNFEHVYNVQVLAKPRVLVRPHFQWSFPYSRVSFECYYDYIDTSYILSQTKSIDENYNVQSDHITSGLNGARNLEPKGQFGLNVEWSKDNEGLIVDSNQFSERLQMATTNNELDNGGEQQSSIAIADYTASTSVDDSFYTSDINSNDTYPSISLTSPTKIVSPKTLKSKPLSQSSSRASITMASSRLTLEDIQLSDTGHYMCRVEVPLYNVSQVATNYSPTLSSLPKNLQTSINNSSTKKKSLLFGQDQAKLLVQERPKSNLERDRMAGNEDKDNYEESLFLWIFHNNGMSIYKLQNYDGQEMELVREINGHSLVSSEVDGNWNQLTLCGGLNPEQVVICEWSDNALYINAKNPSYDDELEEDEQKENEQQKRSNSKQIRKYVYVGQPNLNRIIVMDALRFEIVAIINTEPQPRKLHLYKPNKIHLSKWVRRRLSATANARWLSAIGTRAHDLKSTPESTLYSLNTAQNHQWQHDSDNKNQMPKTSERQATNRRERRFLQSNQLPSNLIQHDIWLLCYGQPLVVDPSGSEDDEGDFMPSHLNDPKGGNSFYHHNNYNYNRHYHHYHSSAAADSNSKPKTSRQTSSNSSSIDIDGISSTQSGNTVQPFTPRLSAGNPVGAFAWSVWPNKESKLRNRKSVHIIQSTILPHFLQQQQQHLHRHFDDANENEQMNENFAGGLYHERKRNLSVVGEFKRSTVLTTHHVFPGITSKFNSRTSSLINPFTSQKLFNRAANARNQFDLIQDLYVPPRPYSLELDTKHKIHYAYVTHYNERRLFRVSMDEYRYDREIDLQDCDPVNLLTTAQGLLVIQCRAPITHNLIGQLVLDQLTNSRIEFNANIRAQESYLSPDNRYLISLYNNLTAFQSIPTTKDSNYNNNNNNNSSSASDSGANNGNNNNVHQKISSSGESIVSSGIGENFAGSNRQFNSQGQSIIYVQSISVDGLQFKYEIKTAMEISHCSFVWKDGYYVAIFVSTNRREQQSEILSLRLADGRLELMARVPGLISLSRHKDQLIVSPELRLAALSTNQGTFVIDLEDNRVSQSLRHHQSPPTLLWI